MRHLTGFVPLAALLVSALGCSSGTGPAPSNPTLRLHGPSEAHLSQQAVELTLDVGNPTHETMRVPTEQLDHAFDVAVSRPGGDIVWRRVAGPVLGPPHEIVLRAGEHQSLAATWNLRGNNGALVAPGQYTVRGYLLGYGVKEAEPALLLTVLP